MTLDDYKSLINKGTESDEVLKKLNSSLDEIMDMIKKTKKIKIASDYDADGICSAYNLKKMLSHLTSNDISVYINDRRGSYGISKMIEKDVLNLKDDELLLVLDMGTNEYDEIKKYAKNFFIIDHHEALSDIPNEHLLNFKNMYKDTEERPDYCTTGLAYRLYEELSKRDRYSELFSEREINTIKAVAGIGTVADIANINDKYSYNRDIVKNGMDILTNATEDNFDMTWGYFISNIPKISETVLSKSIAFDIVPIINACSRMSTTIKRNGGQYAFDTLNMSFNEEAVDRIQYMYAINEKRKAMVKNIYKTEEYIEAIKEAENNNIAIFITKKPIPHSLLGLVAGTMAETTKKPAIALSIRDIEEKPYYSGSGRNAEGYGELLDNTIKAFGDSEACKFGGHKDAIGISNIPYSEEEIKERLYKVFNEIKYEKSEDIEYVDISAEKNAKNIIEKLIELEPFGNGFANPRVLIDGMITSNTALSDEKWHKLKINKMINIIDFEYSDDKYLLQSPNKMDIELSIDTYANTMNLSGKIKENRSVIVKEKQKNNLKTEQKEIETIK